VTVQRALGHLNASVTLSTYSHLWPKAEDRTRAAAAAMLAASVENAAASLRPQSRQMAVDLHVYTFLYNLRDYAKKRYATAG